MDIGLVELWELVMDKETWGAAIHGITKSQTQLTNWNELNWCWERLRWEKGMTEDEVVGWHHWPNGHELSKFRELVMDRQAWNPADHGVANGQTWLSDWIEHNSILERYIVLMRYVTLIDLQILKNTCISRIIPAWSWCIILFMYCWIWFASILLRIFVSVLSDVGLQSSFSCCTFV